LVLGIVDKDATGIKMMRISKQVVRLGAVDSLQMKGTARAAAARLS
jgi:hypothetical protein